MTSVSAKPYVLQIEGLIAGGFEEIPEPVLQLNFESLEKVERFAKKLFDEFIFFFTPFCNLLIIDGIAFQFRLKPWEHREPKFKEATLHNVLEKLEAAYHPDKSATPQVFKLPIKSVDKF